MNGQKRAMKRASTFSMMAGLLMTALLTSGAEGLAAQRRGAQQPGGGGQRAQMERRIQARFDALVQEGLELGDDQFGQLQEVVEDFRQQRVEFSRRERGARSRIVGWGATGTGRELTEQEASEILAEMLELSGDEATLFREEQEAFLRILSSPQLVRFMVMRQQFGDRIRSLRGGGPARVPQGGRRSGPPPFGR
jgi:hypothetical protein